MNANLLTNDELPASGPLTREVNYHVRHVAGGELFRINEGLPAKEAAQFASFLMCFIQARAWELGDTEPMNEEFTVLHFLTNTASALYEASMHSLD